MNHTLNEQIFPQEALKNWFVANKRALPWREQPTPYHVLISEMMLQQTQASVVIPYFERWMQLFPTILHLAQAPLEQVLKNWEGLGYYARARNLHEIAKISAKQWGGSLPEQREELMKLKGIGEYTASALCAFAFKQRALAIDGNVLRTLIRFFAIEEEIESPSLGRKLQELSAQILPEKEPWLVAEGLIELGATLCGKSPECAKCPLKSDCLAFKRGRQMELPKRKMRKKQVHLLRSVGVICFKNSYLIFKGAKGRVMADLYEFPYIEKRVTGDELVDYFAHLLSIPLSYRHPLPPQSHTFTRYKAFLFPHLISAHSITSMHEWVAFDQMVQLPFSSGHRRILQTIGT
jgi:A/G-specific adenine glycosylase